MASTKAPKSATPAKEPNMVNSISKVGQCNGRCARQTIWDPLFHVKPICPQGL